MKNLLLTLSFLAALQVSAQNKNLQRIVANQVSANITNSNSSTNWNEIEPAINGFSRVLKGNKFTFINQFNQAIAAPQFDGARNFSHHLAAVAKNDKWGFINETGNITIPCQYEIVYDFVNDFTIVYQNKKWVQLNHSGLKIKDLDIDICYGIIDGKISVQKNGIKGHLETDGSFVSEHATVIDNRNDFQRFNQSNQTNLIGDCPDNLTFEFGNFTNWKCYTGTVDSVGTTNVITVSLSGPVANRHRIYPKVTPSAIDFFGLFPTNPPDGSNYAVKLGNTNIGAQAERISYTIRVPQNDSNFSIKYDYAVVFQDPGHTTWSQPRFTAKLFDSAANAYVDCASFEYISTSNLPGFARSTVDTTVIYKPWATAFLSLRAFAGKTMYLEFTTADCVRRGHWGYAYVDVENSCGKSINVQYDCNFPNITTLDGPPGFQAYHWWNQNFSTVLANGQHAVLNPGPAVNSTIWLEMIPFNSFGCRDTMLVNLTGGFTPSFHSTETNASCAPHSFTFFNNNIPSTSATWNFGDGTTGTGDTVSHTYTTTGTYIVTMSVLLPGGCSGSISDTVTITQPVASLTYAGGNFCNSRNVQFQINATGASSYNVNFGDGTNINTTQTTFSHTYSTAGIYLPVVTINYNGGCTLVVPGTDSIKIENINVDFTFVKQLNCNSTTVSFTANAQSQFGISSYSWNFADGTTGTGISINHIFTNPSTYLVKLKVTGNSGCLDSVVHPVTVSIIRPPSASIVSPASICADDSITLHSNINSADSIVSINWTTSNGLTASGDSSTFSFSQAGTYSVTLIVNSFHGCADTAVKQIIVKALPVFNQPADQSVCNGVRTNAVTFTGQVAGTTYSWVNDNTSVGLSAAGIGNIAGFTAINNGIITEYANVIVTATAQGCVVIAPRFTIAVNPTPQAIQPANQTLCNRGMTDPIIFNNFTNAITSNSYSWTNTLPSIGLPANGSGNITSFMAINNSNSAAVATITITPTANGCSGLPVNFTITVNPTPNLFPPLSQNICSGALSNEIIFSGNIRADLISWTNNIATIGLPATGTGDIRPFLTINNTNTPITAVIAAYPTVNGCVGPLINFSITINPIPDMAPVSNITVCNGATVNPDNFTSSVSGTNFSWTNTQSNIGISAIGNGDIPTFIALNNTSSTITSSINVTSLANGCNGPQQNFTITIYPSVSVDSIPDYSVCNGKSIDTISITGPIVGTSFTWTNDKPSIGLASSGTGDIMPFIARNTSDEAIVAIINIYGASPDNCQTAIKTFKIVVNPTPSVNAGNDMKICRGSNANLIVSGAGTYQWSPSTGLSCTTCSNPVSNVTTNTTYLVEGISAAGCRNIDSILVSVIQPFNMIVSPNDSSCTGKSTQLKAMNADHYVWSPSTGLNNPNIAEPIASPTSNIRYQVIGYDADHCFTDTAYVNISVFGVPTVNAGADVQAASGTTVVLNGTAQNGPISSWSWSPANNLSCSNCPSPTLTVSGNTSYILTVENRYGCKAIDTLNVVTFCKSAQVFVPNAFSPDGDGDNDILMVRGTGIKVKSFRIFNRWGNLIFEKVGFLPNDPKYGWDGKVKGVLATPNVFVYIAEVVCDNGTPYFYKGNVTVLQ